MDTNKIESILGSSNDLSSNSMKNKSRQDEKQRTRKQPRSLKTMGSPDRKTTTASHKDHRDGGNLMKSEEKKET